MTLSFETPQDGEYLLEMANMQGQRVFREVVNVVGGRLVKAIDVDGFAEGVYMVSLVSSGNFSTFGVMRELVAERLNVTITIVMIWSIYSTVRR